MEAVQKKKVGTDLTQGVIWKVLIAFAGPIVLANVIQQLYSMVDVMVIGQFVGPEGTVGVTTGGEMADFMTPVATALATAGQIFIAQLVGAKKMDKAKRSIGTLFTISMVSSVILAALCIIFCVPILNALNCPAEAMGQAEAYMIITSLGFPFIFGYNAVCGVLRGMGEAKKPLLFVSVAATVNIFADLLLDVVFPLQAAGTAIATILSQLGSFLAAFYFLYKNKESFDFELKLSYFKVDKDAALTIIKLSIPQLARSTMVRFGMLWVNAQVNSYGLVFSATNSVGNKLQKFLEAFMQGVDTAAAAMIGQNLGAKNTERAKKTVWNTFIIVMIIAAICSVLSLSFPRLMFRLFTKDEEVIELGVTYLRIMVLHFFCSAFVGSFQSMVNGCGFVELGFGIGILDGLVCKIGFSILFMALGFGGLSMWWGTAISRFLPGCLTLGYFLSNKWATRKLLSEKK